MTRDAGWIVPDWPAPPNVRSFITTRSGGASTGPHAGLNLGLRTGDVPGNVAENRARLRAALPDDPRWLAQVHGTTVVAAETVAAPPEADAAFAREPRTVCAIMIADCVPVLLTDRSGAVVGAAHAGWRGLAGGVIANTVSAMCRHGIAPSALIAYIGPGIGPGAFEVGADVYEAFQRQSTECARAFVPCGPGKWLADLFLLVRQALAREGVVQVHGGGLCTFSDPQRFYSYRRDRTTGRMAALIWRE